MNKSYENIGEKIKSAAQRIAAVETVIFVITGIIIMFSADNFLYGLLVLIIGPIIAYVSSWLMYAFGELVENVSSINHNLLKLSDNSTNSNSGNLSDRIRKINALDKLRAEGRLTDEQYYQSIEILNSHK